MSEYLTSIVFFLIFINFVGLIMPSEKYSKFINLCLGLSLILILLVPLENFLLSHSEEINIDLSNLFNEEEYYTYENNIEWNEVVIKTLNAQAKQQLNALLKDEGVKVTDVELVMDEETNSIEEMYVTMEEEGNEIKIDDITPSSTDEYYDIKLMISDYYKIEVEDIHINEN